MRLNGSRVPYRFPTSNIAVKNAKINMATKADTDIFAEVFYVKMEPGAGASFRAVVIKPPRMTFGADGDLTPLAGRERSNWLPIDSTGEQTVDPVRVIYDSQTIEATAQQSLDPIRVKHASQIIDTTFLADMSGDLSVYAIWSGSGEQKIVSTPILYDSAIFNATGESVFDTLRQRIYSPSFNPTAKQDIDILRQRMTSASYDGTISQSVTSKILKLFEPTLEARGEQVLTPKVIGFAYPTFEARGNQDLIAKVEFSFRPTMEATAQTDITSQVQQLISKLVYNGDLTPGDLLTINVEEKTVKVNGENVRHNFEGDFIKLRKGLNKLEYWDEESDRNLEITIDYEPRWL